MKANEACLEKEGTIEWGKEIWTEITDWAFEDVELEKKESFRIQILDLLALAVEIPTGENLITQLYKGAAMLVEGDSKAGSTSWPYSGRTAQWLST